jgi:hypothetical protein
MTLLPDPARESAPISLEPYPDTLIEGSSGGPCRAAPGRAVQSNTQPALACYLCCPTDRIARPYGLIVPTLEEANISTIAWFTDTSIFLYF